MSTTDKWEIYKDKRGEHRWRRRASNGQIVGAANEGYKNRSDCQANAERHGMDGNVKNLGRDDNWEFYKDAGGGHRWRRRATNREIVGTSSEAYRSRGDCEANARRNGYRG